MTFFPLVNNAVVIFFVTFFTSIQYVSLVHMEREEAKFFGGFYKCLFFFNGTLPWNIRIAI